MRTILIKAQDVYNSEEESAEDSASDEFECQISEDAYSHKGDLLMIRRTLNNQPSPQLES